MPMTATPPQTDIPTIDPVLRPEDFGLLESWSDEAGVLADEDGEPETGTVTVTTEPLGAVLSDSVLLGATGGGVGVLAGGVVGVLEGVVVGVVGVLLDEVVPPPGLESESPPPGGVEVSPAGGVDVGGVEAGVEVGVGVGVGVGVSDGVFDKLSWRGATWPLPVSFSISWYLGTSAKKMKPEASTSISRHRPGVNRLSIVQINPGGFNAPRPLLSLSCWSYFRTGLVVQLQAENELRTRLPLDEDSRSHASAAHMPPFSF